MSDTSPSARRCVRTAPAVSTWVTSASPGGDNHTPPLASAVSKAKLVTSAAIAVVASGVTRSSRSHPKSVIHIAPSDARTISCSSLCSVPGAVHSSGSGAGV